ncbi:MAG: CBS domain-containing protein [Nitrososphaeraceae archaeon]|nr:CBS domain-containing protein [Nitrososphaeraceae archaeon]MBV9668214.1 CBS domain-containing protein [Nitrososphaeraceae archaeon]
MTLTIGDILGKKLESIEEMSSVQKAAKKMKDRDVSSLVVVDVDGKPQGLLTERDLVRKVCVNDVSTRTMTSKEIMSSPLITIKSDSTPSAAADMMLKNNVRHLLVVDDKSKSNKPIGIVTPLDFARYQEYITNEDKEAIEKVLEDYVSSSYTEPSTGL